MLWQVAFEGGGSLSPEPAHKTPEEAFPGPFTEARIPIYFEHFIDTGREVEKVTRELGMDWWDTSFYHPMVDYCAKVKVYKA